MGIKLDSQVIIGKRTKKVTLVRSLCGKIAFYPQKTNYKEILVLYYVLLDLQDKSVKDPQFKEKFGVALKVLAYILKNMNLSRGITGKNIENLAKKLKSNLEGFMIPKRNCLVELKKQMQRVEVRPYKTQGTKNKHLPPERYIGIGYRDKGSAKKPWIDGSPSWQEIAMKNIGEL